MGVRDRIRSAKALPVKGVRIPEIDENEDLWVRRVPAGGGRDDLEDVIASMNEGELRGGSFLVRLAAIVLCEEDGTPAYDVHSEEDLAELGKLDPAGLERLFKPALEVNGLSSAAEEDEGPKDSEGAHADASSSD